MQVEGYGLEQGFKGVESNRPKAQSLQQEDQFFWYEYDRRGGLKSKKPKPPILQYHYWWSHIAYDSNRKRILPLSEFEIQMGVKVWERPIHVGQGNYDWTKYWKEHAEKMDLIPVNIGQLEFVKKHPYCIANEIHGSNCNLESTPELQEIIKAENPQPIDKIPTPTRTNPKEVEKIEPIEVEPIKEAVKYSPLMIAGIITVVVILLLKRRRA